MTLAHADANSVANEELAFHRNCAACHSLEKGQNRIGPSLTSIHGRKSAMAEGYSYSATLRQLNLAWSNATLEPFLSDAQRFAPGSKMWVELDDEKTRKHIIEFLQLQSPARLLVAPLVANLNEIGTS
ncbi:c-type cytochrome [Variovorax sp. LjRoot130]